MSTTIEITGTFVQFVGEVVADLKSRELTRIDLDVLRLKREQLRDKLDDFKRDLADAVVRDKARAEQDLISRGLANSTVRDGRLRAIEQDAATQLDRAMREYNRTIDELALMEQRRTAESRPWWKRLFGK
jgi:hypothetical protein